MKKQDKPLTWAIVVKKRMPIDEYTAACAAVDYYHNHMPGREVAAKYEISTSTVSKIARYLPK